MTCEECIHYEACEDKFAGLYKICVDEPKKHLELNPNIENVCEHFKDKTKFVELTCKVGDTVYHYCKTFGQIFPYFIEQIIIDYDTDIPESGYITFCANYNNGEELIDGIDFDVADIGKTVFLSREEAEKRAIESWNRRVSDDQ